MKQKLLTVTKYAFFLSIGIFLLWLSFRHQDFNKVQASLRSAHFSWIGLSIFISFFAFVSRAHRWNMLIKPLGFSPSLANSTYALMVGYFANFAIPRLGEITRCAMLGRAEKIPVDKLIGTVIAERAFDLLTLILILAYLGISQFEILGGFIFNQVIQPLTEKLSGNGFYILILLAVLVLVFFLIRRNHLKNENKQKGGIILKVQALLISVWEGVRTVFKLENKMMFLAHTIFIWANYLLSTYLCFFAFDATSSLGLSEGLFTLAIGGIGMSAPVQGGIGAFHWLVSQGLMLYGIPFDDGLIFATIVHASQSIFMILFGVFSYFMLILKKK